jgi:hypothetical protein
MKKLLISIVIFLVVKSADSQGVGIGITPVASAKLQIESTNSGLLIPRMTAKQIGDIASPALGLLVYQTTAPAGFYYYTGSNWLLLETRGNSWSTLGNTGTNPTINYLGTNDNNDLVIKRNALTVGRIGFDGISFGSDAALNFGFLPGAIAIGKSAQKNNTIPFAIAIGDSSLANNGIGATGLQGRVNLAIGNRALTSNTIGYMNTAIGHEALRNNVSGIQNIAIGQSSLQSQVSGNTNIAIGVNTLSNNVAKSQNTAIGHSAMSNFTNNATLQVTNNTAIGYGALIGANPSTHTGINNTSIGSLSMENNGAGEDNIATGFKSLNKNTSGSRNTAIGKEALFNSTTGSGNVALGHKAGFNETGSNKLYIDNTDANKDNALIYGDFSADSLLLNGKVTVKDDFQAKGFTKLGNTTNTPAIKVMTLKFNSSSNSGGTVNRGHGLDDSKIIGCSVHILTPFNGLVPPNDVSFPDRHYTYFIGDGRIYIKNVIAKDANIKGRPVRVMITYEE